MSDEPTPLRDIHAMLDQAGIAPGNLGARVASALAGLAAWQAKADELAENLARTSSVRDQAITERNAAWRETADLRVTLSVVCGQRDDMMQRLRFSEADARGREKTERRAWTPDPSDPLLPILGNKPASTANDCQLEDAIAMVALAESGKPNGIRPQDLVAYRAMASQGTKQTCRECLTVLEPAQPVEQRAASWADERLGGGR